ncbi:MAG TPA: arylsulfotransferase family protein [Candidatus Dormibacteraeota bacterium]
MSARGPKPKPLATRASCPGVSVYPSPNTKTASPTTQISFRNASALAVTNSGVTVTGAQSGVHSGRWVADSDRRGASFYPTKKFTAGEKVTVTTDRPLCGAGGNSDHFQIAIRPGPLAKSSPAKPAPTPTLDQPTTTYLTMPSVHVPQLSVAVTASLGGGYIFESPQGGTVLGGPMIVDGKGNLVWFEPLPPTVVAADFRVQTYHGEPVLTYWQGKITDGHGNGVDIVMNSSYQVIATIKPGDGYSADLHEFLLTDSGNTAWVTAFNSVGWNLKAEGGPANADVLDGIVQEVDVATGNVLFEWHSLDHAAISLSNQDYQNTAEYDYFHVNGIDPLTTGLVLVSSRNTSTVYGIAKGTGRVVWRLGGKQSCFKMGTGAEFKLQHNAVMHGRDTISIFDDEDASPDKDPGRAIILNLNFTTRHATLDRTYAHSGLIIPAQGNVQLLANGDVVVGWGSGHATSEFTKHGKLLFDAAFGTAISSYRAYLDPWVGTPTTPPAVATADPSSGGLSVYASWNGSTQTSRWEVLGGSSPGHLTVLATVRKHGFQTSVHLASVPALVQVVAEGSDGEALAGSAVISSKS